MDKNYQRDITSAIQDFENARRKADLREILARIRGESTELLAFDDVRQKLRGHEAVEQGLQEVPLNAIIGSVGRYTDFTREFLPRRSVDQERWTRVQMATTDMTGLPPVEVYKVGEAYFVKDGNHRVSVARELGADYIEAYVTEIKTRVPLTPEVQPDDLIIKAEYTEFLENTHLDELRPGSDLSVSVPGKYEDLIEHIAVHRYFMGLERQHEITWEQAVIDWYDTVYMPVIEIIRDRGVMQFFPGRTETDLYLWIGEHQETVQKELGWQVAKERAASDLVDRYGPKTEPNLARLGERLAEALSIDVLESGPAPGKWREERLTVRRDDRLFSEILVGINGEPSGWAALDQALAVAWRENAYLHGLHVLPDPSLVESDTASSIQAEFDKRCREASVGGQLVYSYGDVTSRLCERSRWTDLVVISLNYPPAPTPLARLSSGMRELIQRCPRPVLVAPRTATHLEHALLAYDGSPKAREALFVATYVAGRWNTRLTVLSVSDSSISGDQTVAEARDYLEDHSVQAEYLVKKGKAGEEIIKAGREKECDFLIMGGYGANPMLEVVIGSTVDQILRECNKPALICR